MVRWEAGAEGRLTRAAYELFLERGYDQVTVAEIAERAGLTRRTFFRYFSDKREVLFSGATEFQTAIVSSVADAPAGASPMDAVVDALALAGERLLSMGDGARQRQRLIDSSADLREREMIKMALLATDISDALRDRGVHDPVADLTAQAGVTVFLAAFRRWALQAGPVAFRPLIHQVLDELRAVVEPASEPDGAVTRG